jgi:hypothetical protein
MYDSTRDHQIGEGYIVGDEATKVKNPVRKIL